MNGILISHLASRPTIQCIDRCACNAVNMSHTKEECEKSLAMMIELAEKIDKQRREYLENA